MKRALIAVLLFVQPGVLHGQQAAPELSLSANGQQTFNLYLGWPLILHITIMNSTRFGGSGGSAPLVIAPNNSSWTDAIQLTAVSSSGTKVQWPLKLVGTPGSPSLTLPPTSYVRAFWQISPSDVAAIPPDTYELTATLQVANSGGWNGSVQSRPVTIQAASEPALSPDLQSEKAILLSEYQLNSGDSDGAFATMQQLMQAQPTNTLAMTAAANVLELQGYPNLAYVQARAAADAYYGSKSPAPEPPSNLLTILKRTLETSLAGDSAETPTEISVSPASVVFSHASQTVALSALVTATANGFVDGGTVTFVVSGVGNPVTSSPASGGNVNAMFTVPGATAAGNYSIQAIYSGTSNFAPSTDTTQVLSVIKATPTIVWSDPASIPSGTALGPAQLNATASAPGTFAYNPPAGTVLPSGSTQTLSVTFTPSDSTDYNSVTASVSITVLAGSFSGSASPTSATIKVGQSQNFVITIDSTTFQGAVSFGCAHPPKGISCSFSPNSANLTANASSTTKLTVTVSAKPSSGGGFPSLRIPAGQRSARRTVALQFAMTLLALAALLMAVGLRRSACFATLAPKLSLALFMLLAISMTSCTSATVVGGGNSTPGGGGGASPAAAVSLVVQGTSGNTVIPVATIPITVP
jgi:hypothetical protein